jgi:hypothetical protein
VWFVHFDERLFLHMIGSASVQAPSPSRSESKASFHL